MLAHLLSGRTQREAAELVGVDEKTVSRWMQEPVVRQEFATQLAAISTELWGRVAAEVADAWEVFRALLRSEDERISLRACTFFLGRVLAVLPVERLLEEGRLAATPMPSEVARFFEEPGEAGGGTA
ncbi:MAG: helix-turn-helix domain-containing protein [Actinomycetota bacterium]